MSDRIAWGQVALEKSATDAAIQHLVTVLGARGVVVTPQEVEDATRAAGERAVEDQFG